MKTTFMANASNIERKWYVVDAEGQTVGRLAAEVAKVLRGKNKPTFTPHVDTGDYVIVVNADKVKFTGKKLVKKTYFRHSGYWSTLSKACCRTTASALRCSASSASMLVRSIRMQRRSRRSSS